MFLRFFIFSCVVLSTYGKTADEYLNTCMTLPDYQKSRPGPEPNLFGECASWRDKACCQYNTTEPWELEMFDFNWSHCSQHRNLSESCRRYLSRDICLNQCSPWLGPWNVMGERRSRHVNVPLCQSSCNDWWDACKDSYTCVANWWKDFNYTGDSIQCPAGSTCKPMTEFYTGATQFCETIWHDSYKVTPDNDDCIVFYFNGTNPNEEVGRKKAQNLANGAFHLVQNNVVEKFVIFCLLSFGILIVQ